MPLRSTLEIQRLAFGVTETAMAQKVGVSRQTIHNWETEWAKTGEIDPERAARYLSALLDLSGQDVKTSDPTPKG